MQLKTFRNQPPQAAQRIHETEKPVSLLQRLLLLHTSEGDVVFDAYAGSFSTAIACHNEKRKFIGCEILGKVFSCISYPRELYVTPFSRTYTINSRLLI